MIIGLFTYITGIATLLGLFIQLKDVFPQHREARKNTILIILGLFIGTIIGSLQRISLNFTVPVRGLHLLVGAIIVVVFIILISAVFTNDNKKRGQLFGVSAFGTVFLFVILFGYFLLQSPALTSRSFDNITNDEMLILSDIHENKANFERSIYLLKKVIANMEKNDSRYKLLEDKVSDLKKKQIGYSKENS
jgi:heme A synthase